MDDTTVGRALHKYLAAYSLFLKHTPLGKLKTALQLRCQISCFLFRHNYKYFYITAHGLSHRR